MDINVSQMESQDIIKVVVTQCTIYTNVSLGVIIIQLFYIVWKEKNIEKLIITIMMIISFNNQTTTREDMLRVWYVQLLEFRKVNIEINILQIKVNFDGFIATAEQTGITRVVLTQHTTYYRGSEHFARFTYI